MNIADRFGLRPRVVVDVAWSGIGSVKYGYVAETGILKKLVSITNLQSTIQTNSGVSVSSVNLILDDADSAIKTILEKQNVYNSLVSIYLYYTNHLVSTPEIKLIAQGQIVSPLSYDETSKKVSFTVFTNAKYEEIGFAKCIQESEWGCEEEGQMWPLAFGKIVRQKIERLEAYGKKGRGNSIVSLTRLSSKGYTKVVEHDFTVRTSGSCFYYVDFPMDASLLNSGAEFASTNYSSWYKLGDMVVYGQMFQYDAGIPDRMRLTVDIPNGVEYRNVRIDSRQHTTQTSCGVETDPYAEEDVDDYDNPAIFWLEDPAINLLNKYVMWYATKWNKKKQRYINYNFYYGKVIAQDGTKCTLEPMDVNATDRFNGLATNNYWCHVDQSNTWNTEIGDYEVQTDIREQTCPAYRQIAIREVRQYPEHLMPVAAGGPIGYHRAMIYPWEVPPGAKIERFYPEQAGQWPTNNRYLVCESLTGDEAVYRVEGTRVKDGQTIIADIPSSFYEWKIVELDGRQALVIDFRAALEEMVCGNWTGDVYVSYDSGNPGNPAQIIDYLVSEFGSKQLDYDSYDVVLPLTSDLYMSFVITQKTSAKTVIEKVAKFGMIGLSDIGDKIKMVYLGSAGTSTLTLDEDNVLSGLFNVEWSDSEDVYQKYIGFWKKDGYDEKTYQIAYAPTDESSGREVLRESVEVYNGVNAVRKIVRYLGVRSTNSFKRIILSTSLVGATVQPFDPVTVNVTSWAESILGRVVSKTLDFVEMKTTLTIEFPIPLGSKVAHPLYYDLTGFPTDPDPLEGLNEINYDVCQS